MDELLVSIIIPTYNRAHLIGETLDSILAQTYQNWECIVVDDGSSDNTEEILKSYCESDSRFIFYKRPNESPKGANFCRNYGFMVSKGAYINWFDSDDLMMPEKLSSQVARLSKSIYDFTVCQTLVFENNINNIIGLRAMKIFSKDYFNDFITNDIKWLTQAPLFKRSYIENLDYLFDETIHKSQERDFFVNILADVDGYDFDDTPLVLFRQHNESISFGKGNSIKTESKSKVDYRIIKKYGHRLNKKSFNKLINSLKSNLRYSIIVLQNKELSTKIKKMLNDECVPLSALEKFKLNLGVFLMLKFNKGLCLLR